MVIGSVRKASDAWPEMEVQKIFSNQETKLSCERENVTAHIYRVPINICMQF